MSTNAFTLAGSLFLVSSLINVSIFIVHGWILFGLTSYIVESLDLVMFLSRGFVVVVVVVVVLFVDF